MIVKVLLLLVITLKISRSSLVVDNFDQQGLFLKDYCPNMKYCREGSHVMCMYYDPNKIFGPRCFNAVKIPITVDLANKLLDVTNTIRSKIANGKETGQDGALPRGYGIFRLRWDSELATFAQVLANMCVLKRDMCRATKRFPNPSQIAGLVRFTFPDWQLMTKEESPPGLSSAKLEHAITNSLRSWYAQKSSVTEYMVKVYPDWSATPTHQLGQVYLEMIHGPATHMGCGMSAYSEYVFYENQRQGIHNSILVICNFSAGPRKGTNTYETVSPIPGQGGFSSNCGCPPGSQEDADCLCNELDSQPRSREPTCATNDPSGNNCDPTLVLLPIFTMEDAPPDKLYQIAEEIKDPLKNFILQRIDNTSDTIERQGSFIHESAGSPAEIFDYNHAKKGEDVSWQRARNPSSVQSQAPSYNKLDNTSDTIEKQSAAIGSFIHESAGSPAEIFDYNHAKKGEDVSWQRARNPYSVQSQASSYNKLENTSDTIEKQGSFIHESAGSPAEIFDYNHAKKGEDVSWQRARNPYSVQSQASSYNKLDNTSDTIEKQGSFIHESAGSPAEIFDYNHAKKGEDVSWQRARNPYSVQSQASSYKNLHRENQAASVFSLGPDSKPPPPPPRKSSAVRYSPPARPAPRPRPPPRLSPLPPPPSPPRIPPPPPPLARDEDTSALNDHEELRPAPSKDKISRPLPKLPLMHRPKTKKASLFTRVAQFQLPKRKSMSSPSKVIKKNVAPRKDFSNLSKVVHDYLKSRPGYKIFNDNHEQNKPKEESKPSTEEKSQTEAVVTDTGLNSAEETVINFNQYYNQKNNSNYYEKDVDIKDDNDNKLISLLDTLEREVKHIALDGNEKELFDAKIRKIYGSIVGKAALLKFPKPIILSTADIEAHEIEFGETKVSDRFEPDHEGDNYITVTEEPKQRSRYKVDQTMGRGRHYNPSVQGHKWKNKFKDSFDHKEYKDNMDVFRYGGRKPPRGGSYEHKYKDNVDHEYGDINQKHMDDLDRKYNENINKKYNENHLDHGYKFNDTFYHQQNDDLDKKYDDNEPVARSKNKYVADRSVFREFEHNSLDTQEDTTLGNYRYKGIKGNHGTPEVPLITKDCEKRKRIERKHRKRVKSLNTRNGHNDPLSLERRKYYQEKLDNIRKKLRNRKNRNNNDSKHERSLRRMHSKNRMSSRSRSKSQADNFYMPERARFLHGF